MLGQTGFFCAAGFLLGSIPFSYLVPKSLAGIDIVLCSADGNPGTANAVKYAGLPIGLLCLALDLGKGFLPVRLMLLKNGCNDLTFALVMLAPVLGHAFSPFMRWHGGKAIAATFGVLIGILPVTWAGWGLVAFYVASLFFPLHPNEKRTIAAFVSFAVLAALLPMPIPVKMGCMAMAGVVIAKNLIDAGFVGEETSKTDERIMTREELCGSIDALADKTNAMKNDVTEQFDISKEKRRDNIEAAKGDVINTRESFRITAGKGGGRLASELLNVQTNVDKLNKNAAAAKAAHDDIKARKAVEETERYAADAIAMAVLAIDEAHYAMLAAADMRASYEEEHGEEK